MKKIKLTLSHLLVFIILFSCTAADGSKTEESDRLQTPKGKVFLRTTMFGSNLSISWIYLGADGSIVVDPKYGVNPINLVSESKENATNTGTYKVVGTAFQIVWKNGKSASWKFEKAKGEYSAIDGGIVTVAEPLPTNYKLNGKYAAGAVTANLSSSSTLNFTPDGKFSEGRYGAVSTAETGASSADQRGGNYTVTGNTLKLKYNSGENYIAVVGMYKISDLLTYFIINSSSYKQEK